MPGYNDSWDPNQANHANIPLQVTAAGLVALTAFSALSIGGFLTPAAVLAGPLLDGGVMTGAGNVYFGLTLEAAEAMDAAFAGGVLTQEAATGIMTTAIINGGSTTTGLADAAALIALDSYEPPHPIHHGILFDIHIYLDYLFDNIDPHTGEPPQGGGAGGHAPHPGNAHLQCYVIIIDGHSTQLCYWEPN